MVAPKKEGYGNNKKSESSDRSMGGGDSSEEPREIDGFESSGGRTAGGLTARLRDALQDESDGDLLLDRREVETGILPWLRALDLHVLGACRADERLKPLLKLNISGGLAEERLIAQLSQHFDASEVGMLARCLCVPLVSIRVGKVNKQGNILCPTATRGYLNLSLLPSSNMRISFIGDDGCTDRLCVLNDNTESSEVVIDEISADSSERSFLLKLPKSQALYFWCSEKSKDWGMELLAKMKDLLRRKPSLAHLTGISESRLDSFATHLRAYLLGSSKTGEADPLALSGESLTSLHASDSGFHSSSMVSKSSRCRFTASTTKGQPSHQVCLSPRPNTFKEGTARSSSSIRNGIKEKLKRRGDGYHSSLSSADQPSTAISSLCTQSISQQDDSIRGGDVCSLLPSITQPEMPFLSSCLSLSIPLLSNLPPPPITASSSLFSPYYCWCPPCPSSLQYSVSSSHLPITFDESMPLPPLSSFLSPAVPPVSLVTSSLPLDVPKLSALNFTSLLPESFVCLPIPVTTLVTLPSSQQISTFTPYMSDPIVHTPVIDVCSSGQGYLVSAGPAISSAIPPLLSSFVNRPLIPNTESAVEKSARETLRMLMASTPVSSCQKPMVVRQKPMIVLPEIDGVQEISLGFPGSSHDAVAARSQGLYTGSLIDVEAVAMGLSSIGLSSSRSKFDYCVKRGKLERNYHDCAEDREDCSDE